MNFLKKMKKLTLNNIVLILAGAALVYAIMNYTNLKSKIFSGMENSKVVEAPRVGNSGVAPANPLGQNSGSASANGASTNTYGLPSSCAKQEVVDPSELLPKDTNSEFSKLNPMGSGDLQNVNLLQAGHHIGINTVGQSLRNANLQIRSEPANPQMNVGPWNNSTITGDPHRKTLEIGN